MDQKRLKIAATSLSVRNLKTYLEKIKDDNKPVSFELVVGSKLDSDKTMREKILEDAVKKLEHKCHVLYDLLVDAKPLVAKSAGWEKKNHSRATYYDKRDGYNTGATGLLEDIKEQLDAYTSDMIQINLECGT